MDEIIGAAQACLARQGVPDVVIANAGISIGMDSAERADLDVMARTFATNNLGLAATFHPFIEPMRQRGSGALVGIASVAANPRFARTRGAMRQQGRRGELLRKPARRVARQRRARGDPAAGLCRYATDPRQPLPDALHAQPGRVLPHAPCAPLPRAPATASFLGPRAWPPSCCACCPMRCSTGCWPGARARRGKRRHRPGRPKNGPTKKGSRGSPLLWSDAAESIFV